MALLQIKKLSTKVWEHIADIGGSYVLTKFMAKKEFNKFFIVEVYGSKRFEYSINEIEVYDIGGVAETFTNFEDLFLRLEILKYTGFYIDGEFTFNPSSYDLSEFQNNEVDRFAKLSDITAGGDDTFTLSFPRLAISGNATNVFFASFINTSRVLFNSSTAIADHTLLTSLNFGTTTLFKIPQNCIIDKITARLNVRFEISIWKADSSSSPTTGKTEVFYEVSSGNLIENYNVASPTLSQGNIIVIYIKTLGGTTTYFGDLFITFKTI
jgi:hypothetical protein